MAPRSTYSLRRCVLGAKRLRGDDDLARPPVLLQSGEEAASLLCSLGWPDPPQSRTRPPSVTQCAVPAGYNIRTHCWKSCFGGVFPWGKYGAQQCSSALSKSGPLAPDLSKLGHRAEMLQAADVPSTLHLKT